MLAGLPGTPNESSEHKERLAALLPITAASVLENARLLRKPNARTVRQRCKLFAWGLQSALQVTCLQCRLRVRGAYRAMPRHGASLRAAFAPFFGKAKVCHVECFAGGATHRPDSDDPTDAPPPDDFSLTLTPT